MKIKVILAIIFASSIIVNIFTISKIIDNNKSVSKVEQVGVPIYADGVIDFIYHTQDNEYVIEYNDNQSNFTKDDMLYNEDYKYYYLEIYVDSSEFYDYLKFYNTVNRYDSNFFKPNINFGIIKDSIGEEGDITYYYRLVKNC